MPDFDDSEVFRTQVLPHLEKVITACNDLDIPFVATFVVEGRMGESGADFKSVSMAGLAAGKTPKSLTLAAQILMGDQPEFQAWMRAKRGEPS